MKTKSRNLISALLAAALAFSLLAAMSAAASEEVQPFQVTENPIGAYYLLGETAVPLSATFEYNTTQWEGPDYGSLYSSEPITVQWYWSYENSNTDRSNGFEPSTVAYAREIKHTTTHVPATDEVGVKYYYAVISYHESVTVETGVWGNIPREAVTDPARIEVVGPKEEEEEDETEFSFTVTKTDEEGAPLAGATIRLEGLTSDGAPRVTDVVSNSNGEAAFTVGEGEYTLSEHAAPTGYNATDETYAVRVTANGLYIYAGQNRNQPVEEVVFVNKKIPELNRDDHFAYMQGYPDSTFKPGSNMTRAEAVVMFSRLLVETMDLSLDYRYDCYPDVDHQNASMAEPWYANQVCYMHLKGVLKDYSRDGMFRPNEPVTRAEFATLASHFDNLILTDTNKFTDVPNNHWAVKYINSAAAKGWIEGYPGNTFMPEANITRAEVVTLVNRMVERKADEEYLKANISKLPRVYTDLTAAHWAYFGIYEASTGHDYTKDSSGNETWTAVKP